MCARSWCAPFFLHYNHEHHHEGSAWLTPATVHGGQAPTVLAQRQLVLDAAYQQHPERFVNGPPRVPPRVPQLPMDVWINQVGFAYRLLQRALGQRSAECARAF